MSGKFFEKTNTNGLSVTLVSLPCHHIFSSAFIITLKYDLMIFLIEEIILAVAVHFLLLF